MSNLIELKRQRDNLLQEARTLLTQAELTNQRIDRTEAQARLEEEDDEEFEDSWESSWEDSGC